MAIVGDAWIVVHAITADFEREVEQAMSRMRPQFDRLGNDLGNRLNRGFNSGSRGMFSNFMRESEAAKNKFNSLIKLGYYVGPAISGAIASISSLVSGLFAVGSAAGAAIPSVVALGGAFSALIQGGIVAKLAFSGISKALQQQSQAATGAGDKHRQLAKEYQRYAEAMYDANKRLTKAQKEYNLAVKEGAEWMQQLGFDAEDAALAQQRAAIELADARKNLLAVQDQPMGSRARVEADLAFREADLNYRRAADRASDLTKQKAEADMKGLEGTKQVVDAQENLTEAQRNLLKVQRDHEQALAEIKSRANAATSAMSRLSKEAQHFVKYLMSLRPELDKLKASAGKDLFPQLEKAIGNLVTNLFPVLNPILRKTGDALGYVAVQFSKMLTLPGNINIIKRVFGDTNPIVIRNFGDAFTNIAQAVLYILDAARPITLELSLWAKNASASWAAMLGAKNATGELTTKFQTAALYFKEIMHVLGQVGGGIKALGAIAAPVGLRILTAFGGAFEKLENYAKSPAGAATLAKQFEQIGNNVIAIGGFFTDLIKIMFKMGADSGVESFFTRLRKEAIPVIEKIVTGFSEASPYFEDFVIEFIKLVGLFTESGGIKNFFKILSGALKVLNEIFKNETVQRVFLFLAAVHGVTLAFGALSSVAGTAFKILFGKLAVLPKMMMALSPTALAAQMNALGDGFANTALKMETARASSTSMTAAFGNMRAGASLLLAELAPFIAIAAVIAAVVAVIILAYKNSEILRKSVSDLVSAVGGALKEAFDTILDAIKQVLPQIQNWSDLWKTIGDFLGKYIIPIFKVVLVTAIQNLASVISGVIKIVGGLFYLFTDPVKGIKLIWSGFVDFIKALFNTFISWFRVADIFGLLSNSFKAAINKIIKWWNDFKLQLTIPDNAFTRFLGIANGGFTIETPNISPLARGGIVMPKTGGTLAQIAEAGRPERVEPLDPDGLSKRDKAMIEMMINRLGVTGQSPTVIVNPGPRMDEVEIGHIAARQVAWSLRRGGGF